jgi:hypothetical protein
VAERKSARAPIGCDYADCGDEATVALRFGDGTVRAAAKIARQSFAFYCRQHAGIVQRTFVTCDERPAAGARSFFEEDTV